MNVLYTEGLLHSETFSTKSEYMISSKRATSRTYGVPAGITAPSTR